MSLFEAVSLLAPKSSKTSIKSWLKEGRVLIDNEIAKIGTTEVLPGQTISLAPKSHYLEEGVKVLYEDRYIIVVDKPEGLLSVATAFEKGDTLHGLLKKKFHQPIHVVHRLDQETSGVMVFALNEKARDGLKKIWEKHEIERSYTAVVEGICKEQTGTWQCYLVEADDYHVYPTKDPSIGRLATTHFRCIKSTNKFSLLELTLDTGRKNQIRVHCQEAGHPIVGDKKYGSKKNPLKRMALHAHFLGFPHPITGKQLRFSSPVPDSFLRLIKLGKEDI